MLSVHIKACIDFKKMRRLFTHAEFSENFIRYFVSNPPARKLQQCRKRVVHANAHRVHRVAVIQRRYRLIYAVKRAFGAGALPLVRRKAEPRRRVASIRESG